MANDLACYSAANLHCKKFYSTGHESNVIIFLSVIYEGGCAFPSYLTGENQEVVCAEFSTLSSAVLFQCN